MNKEDQKMFEACKDVANRLDIPQTSWLCTKVEELEKEASLMKREAEQAEATEELYCAELDLLRDLVFGDEVREELIICPSCGKGDGPCMSCMNIDVAIIKFQQAIKERMEKK